MSLFNFNLIDIQIQAKIILLPCRDSAPQYVQYLGFFVEEIPIN